jgi:hypothetical protein
MWTTWRDKNELIKKMTLLTKLNMVHRGEDVDDTDVVSANVESTLWSTIAYILKKTSKLTDKHDIFDLYLPNAHAMANTNERKANLLELVMTRNKA